MRLKPATLEELKDAVRAAVQAKGRLEDPDLSAFQEVLAYHPEDMTVTVQAGLPLAALQRRLGEAKQWLPLDPAFPERITVGQLLAENLSGPRRYGYGTVREHLIGIRVLLVNGAVIKSGGQVVKNVAGYDLCKLFIGARGSLGIIVEATFKVRPLPEASIFLARTNSSVNDAFQIVDQLLELDVSPMVLDAWSDGSNAGTTLVLAFEGSREETVWQQEKVERLGFVATTGLDHDRTFWNVSSTEPLRKASVLPSALAAELEKIGRVPFLCRAGNGVVWYRGGPAPAEIPIPRELSARVKSAFDPQGIFPDLA